MKACIFFDHVARSRGGGTVTKGKAEEEDRGRRVEVRAGEECRQEVRT